MEQRDLYVVENGCVIKKSGVNFLVYKNGTALVNLPYSKIDKLVLVGSQSITPKAVEFALDKEKDILFLSLSGKLKGSIIANSKKNVYLRLAQYELWRDKEARLRIAKDVVKGKVANQQEFLRGYSKGKILDLNIIFKKIENATDLNELLGIEGECSRRYFSTFDDIIKGEFRFEKRSKMPPRNEVNALLSLTYTMVLNNILCMIKKECIDSYIGFLHTIKYGRESLGLDLLEQFRSFCDLTVVKWINRGEFKKGDFMVSEEKGIVLTESGFRKYIGKFNDCFKDLCSIYIPKEVSRFKGVLINGGEYRSYKLRE